MATGLPFWARDSWFWSKPYPFCPSKRGWGFIALIVWVIALLMIIVGFISAFVSSAKAHSWYPNECCHGDDCFHTPPGEVVITPNGFYVNPTGELIPFSDPRVRYCPIEGRCPELDHIHRCTPDGTPTDKTKCMFVPGGMM